jgi:FKBP-type peptidyl-prolyl cis-trans isomerase 2
MKQIKENDIAYVHYTGKFENGTIFDTSKSREPLEVKIGSGQVIKGFENALIGMSPGETKTVHIPTEEAYGEKNDYMIQEVPKEKVPKDVSLSDVLEAPTPMGPINFVVIDIKEDTVTLDSNHPLAGFDLIFDLEIVSVTSN